MLTCPFFLFAATSWTRLVAEEGGSATPCRRGGARRAWLIRARCPDRARRADGDIGERS